MLFSNREYYVPESDKFGSFNGRVDRRLKIGVIGDSWAAGRKMDYALSNQMYALNFSAEIVSYGHPGGKSREILRDLCANELAASILHDEDIDVFVLMVGVNDSKGYDGPDFYGYHMDQILDLILSHGAVAVVLDVPDFDLESIEVPSLRHWCKRTASRYLFDGWASDNRPAYRARLATLAENRPGVVVIDHQQLPKHIADPTLWRDAAHLNEHGYAAVAKPIAAAVRLAYIEALRSSDKVSQSAAPVR